MSNTKANHTGPKHRLDPIREDDANRDAIGYVLAAFGAMLFSLKAVLVKLAYLPVAGQDVQPMDAITLMLLRLGFAFPVYIIILVIVLRRRRKRAAEPFTPTLIAKVLAAGVLCFYVCTWLDFSGLQYITAQLERLLLFTYPVFVVIFGALFFGGRISRYGALAVVVAYSGIGIIFAGGSIATGSNVPLGSALVLSAAVLFAIYQLISKGLIDQMGAQAFTCIAMIGAGAAVVIHFIISAGSLSGISQALDLSPHSYALGAAIAFFSTILPSFMIANAVARVGAQAVAILAMIGPVATIVGAVFILGEPFGWVDALGTLVTMCGIACYTLIDKRAKIKARSVDPGFVR